MSATTGIQWTDATWNPVVGCERVSPGCAHCYAKQIHDMRHKAHGEGKQIAAQYAQPFEVVQLKPERLRQPLSWRKPKKVFVNSVADLFHDDVPDVYIDRVFAVMALAPRHTFQVLTKRAERMRSYMAGLQRSPVDRLTAVAFEEFGEDADCTLANVLNGYSWWRSMPPRGVPLNGSNPLWPLPNVWLGVSVENQHFADERIPLLMETEADVRFLSCEPLLGRVQLDFEDINLRSWDGRYVDWVIIGGESGKDARRFELNWGESLIDQCTAHGVPVFMKQIGAHVTLDGFPYSSGGHGDNMERWPNQFRVREFPAAATIGTTEK